MTTPNTSATAATNDSGANTTAASAPTPAAGAAPAGQSQVTSSPSDWTAGLNDEMRGFVQNKGFKDPTQVLDSYRNLEKAIGVPADQLIKLPKDMADAKAMADVYAKLGRPENADGYGLKAPEGGSEELTTWAKGTFHELGLSQKQGQALFAKWNEMNAAMAEQQNQEMQTKLQADETALKREWGAAFDVNSKVAANGARKFGIDGDTMDKLESVLGYQGVMKLFHKFGQATGEDSYVGAGSGNGFGVMTPEAARSRISQLKGDQEWTKRYFNGGAAERAEMDRLQMMSNSG